jgi:hypothetical protein
MDVTFFSSSEIPLPPEEIRFRSLTVEPYPDGRRVQISLEISPFQVRPNVDITVLGPEGEPTATAHIVEASEPKMTLTLHLRRSPSKGVYSASLTLGYPDREPVDTADVPFELKAAPANPPD